MYGYEIELAKAYRKEMRNTARQERNLKKASDGRKNDNLKNLLESAKNVLASLL